MYLDTNCFIYSVERIEPFRTLLEPVWNEARKARFEIISSEIIVAETLVKPFDTAPKARPDQPNHLNRNATEVCTALDAGRRTRYLRCNVAHPSLACEERGNW